MAMIQKSSIPNPYSGGKDRDSDSLYGQVCSRLGLQKDSIEDMLPCTPSQRDVLDCAAEHGDGRRALGHVVYEVSSDVDLGRLAAAWRAVVRKTAALRTCIFTPSSSPSSFCLSSGSSSSPSPGDPVQVVLCRRFFTWARLSFSGLDSDAERESIIQDEAGAATAGPRCNRFVVLESEGAETEKDQRRRRRKVLLIWTFHHALVNKRLRERVSRLVKMIYDGDEGEIGKLQLGRVFEPSGTLRKNPVSEASKVDVSRGTEDATTTTTAAAAAAAATSYWKHHFDGLDASVFPTLPSSSHADTLPNPKARAEVRVMLGELKLERVEGEEMERIPNEPWNKNWSGNGECQTVCRVALAVLLARVTFAPEALFGILDEGQHEGDGSTGAQRVLLPIRVSCAPEKSVLDVVEAVAAHDQAMCDSGFGLGDGQAGLCNIRRSGEDGAAACGFQTILLVTVGDEQDQIQTKPREPSTGVRLQTVEEPDPFSPFDDRALLLHCHVSDASVLITARYDRDVIDEPQTQRFLRQLGSLIRIFCSPDINTEVSLSRPIGSLDLTTVEDRAEIAAWSTEIPQAKEGTIHGLFTAAAVAMPDKIAVDAWDGEWTYAQLEDISSRLAVHIHAQVHPNTTTPSQDQAQGQTVVPICFEKSKWVIAGMLAVLKAGMAFTLVDPSLPRARIAQICRQTRATLSLTSELHQETMASIVDRCIVLDEILQSKLSRKGHCDPAKTNSQDLAYILFTSGSTGEPKGAMIEHRCFVSRVHACGAALGIDANTRSMQFASFAFGSFMVEIIVALVHGGCVCVPSDEERTNDVPGFVARKNVNWALLTPSFIGTMSPDMVPGLETLVSAGEIMAAELRDAWVGKGKGKGKGEGEGGMRRRRKLLNAYGISEIAIICSATDISSGPRNTCRAVGARFWVVDPSSSQIDRLAPIGCIGELVIETAGVARGYIVSPSPKSPSSSPGNTDSPRFNSTTAPPPWYPSQKLPDGVKLYRTGDLVRYRSDGSVVYLGRSDAQVKVRGQRVEAGEVETRLRELSLDLGVELGVSGGGDVIPIVEAVEAFGSKNDDRHTRSGGTHLVAFLMITKSPKRADAQVLDSHAANNINEKLRHILPRHCIPAYYVLMDRLPHTVTGKMDRRRLRSIASQLLNERAQTAARSMVSADGEKEAKLREIWSRGLDLDPEFIASPGAGFFELGGNSISAMRIVNTARLAGIKLRVTDIFDNPTLEGLMAAVCRCQDSSSAYQPIPSLHHVGPVEQSFAQGRLWFLEQLGSETTPSSAYLLPFAVRVRGELRIDALTAALLALEKRHETLRTTFEDRDGKGMQVVHTKIMHELKVINVSGGGCCSNLLQREQTRPFDLVSEPGWRVSLLRLAEDDHILSIVMHHIVSDGWSVDILRRELGQFYSSAIRGHNPLAEMKPLPVTYRDFSVWQKEAAQRAEQERQLAYWTHQLADSSPAEFLVDFPRPRGTASAALLSSRAGSVPIVIEGEVYGSLTQFSRAQKATPLAVLLAAFRAAHYRLTGAEDATVGVPSANRNRAELEDMIGFFVNTQCVRITVDGDNEGDTFESMVQQVRNTVAAASEHQDVPFDRVVSAVLAGGERDVSRNPLVQVVFAVHSQPDLGENFGLEGLEAETLASPLATRFDVEVHLFQDAAAGGNGMSGHMIYAADLFRPETARNIVDVFHTILRRGLETPRTPIAVLPLIEDGDDDKRVPNSDAESKREKITRAKGIIETPYPRDKSIVDLFREQVAAAHPDSLAVTDSSSRLTYAELDRLSETVAAGLRVRGMAPETVVGVLAPRSCETVVALLGIMKANLAYLPLDVKTPTARLEAILLSLPELNQGPEQGQDRRLILLGFDTPAPLFSSQLDAVEVVRISDVLAAHSSTNGQVTGKKPTTTSLAHVIFTSGSTGKPKGVMIEHRNVVRLVRDNAAFPIPELLLLLSSSASAPSNIGAKEAGAGMLTVAHLSNMAFDAATWEIYTALLNGGTLVCVDYMSVLDSESLGAVFAAAGVKIALLTPALLKRCLLDNPAVLAGLNVLVSGGDRLDPADTMAARALVKRAVYNAYGPTENGVVSTVYEIGAGGKSDGISAFANGVPIGRAISNSDAYVMDPNQRLVPHGVVGELVVTGDGLARGYTDPRLDVGRFVHVTVRGRRVRAYRTGDRVRCRPVDGQMEFFGRLDQQVKIRGHRIEPADIERALLENEAVRQAAVVVVVVSGGRGGDEDIDKGPELVGFVVCREKSESGDEQLLRQRILEQLRVVLPSYMVPARIIITVDGLPLNANGKVDRKALVRTAQSMPRLKEVEPAPLSHARASASDETERIVCRAFSDILGLDVGPDDNFFTLGGHSLMATKLAARIGRLLDVSIGVSVGVRVSVKDIFDYPVPARLANKLREQQQKQQQPSSKTCAGAKCGQKTTLVDESAPFQLLSLEPHEGRKSEKEEQGDDGLAFLKREIYPQLENYPWASEIVDVYPATRLQKRYLHAPLTGKPWPLAPFRIDFPAGSDLARLVAACKALVEYFDTFRTIFVSPAKSTRADDLYQVVLKHFDIPVRIVRLDDNDTDTDIDIEAATTSFIDSVSDEEEITLSQPLLRIAILVKSGLAGAAKATNDTKDAPLLRVILRMNHVCYDALSLEHMLQALHALYHGVKPAAPRGFAPYMRHMATSQRAGYGFWRTVLETSTMTVMQDVAVTAPRPCDNSGTYMTARSISVARGAGAESGITQATVFTAAVAYMLAKETGSRDITFGRLVSGRQGLVLEDQTIVGPCTNQVPVRVQLPDEDEDKGEDLDASNESEKSNPKASASAKTKDLLSRVQDQYIASIPFETLNFDEIRDHCTGTGWGAGRIDNYSCNVAYQSFNAQPESRLRRDENETENEDEVVRMGVLPQPRQKNKMNLVEQGLIHDVNIIGDVVEQGERLNVLMFVSKRVCESQERAERMMDELCNRVGSLNDALALALPG